MLGGGEGEGGVDQTGIGMRGDGKKEVMWLACEATRGRGEEATNA
jgi:hypothetical protein